MRSTLIAFTTVKETEMRWYLKLRSHSFTRSLLHHVPGTRVTVLNRKDQGPLMRLGPELPPKSWSALPLTWATSKIPIEEGSRRGGTLIYSDRKVCAFLK